jgi:hypothetical protein
MRFVKGLIGQRSVFDSTRDENRACRIDPESLATQNIHDFTTQVFRVSVNRTDIEHYLIIIVYLLSQKCSRLRHTPNPAEFNMIAGFGD